MALRTRFQYALGFALAGIMHVKVLQDIDNSIQDQKVILSMLDKCKTQQVEFRSDKNENVAIPSSVWQAYGGMFQSWVYSLFKSSS